MASQAQLEANRKNAQKSTGPKTPEGKAVVAQNGTTHGLTARTTLIAGENPEHFKQFRDHMLEELRPCGLLESTLADHIIDLSWRLSRASRIQSGTFDVLTVRKLQQLKKDDDWNSRNINHTPQLPRAAQDLGYLLGQVVISDFSNSKVIDRLLMYERRIEYSLSKTTLELQRLQCKRIKKQHAADNQGKNALQFMLQKELQRQSPALKSKANLDLLEQVLNPSRGRSCNDTEKSNTP
jgi:hypothetical protein